MKTLRKVVAVALALCMCFALCCTAFAASSPETTGSITINGATANETYTIYQIFELTFTSETDDEGNVTATGESYSYKVCEGWEDFLKEQTVNVDGDDAGLFTLTDNGYLDPDSLIFQYEDDADVVAALARAALAYATAEIVDEDTGEASPRITGTSVSYSYTVDESGNITATLDPQGVATIDQTSLSMDENGYVTGDLTFSGLSLGYYLVGTSLGSLCMLDSTDPDAVVNEKNSTPTISKHVYNTADNDWEQEDHENNNTTVTYELDVDHITGAVNLVIHDSQPSELEEDWANFNPNVTLVVGDDEDDRISLTEGTDYTIVLTGTGAVDENTGEPLDSACSDEAFDEAYGCTFEIDFTGYDFSNVSDDAYIEVIYTATLETDGDIYVDDVDEIDNWAVVTFGASSSSVPVEAEVYSFGFEIYKYSDAIEEGRAYQYVITDSVTYDINAGRDAYCLAYLDEDTSTVYYAIFDLGDWDLDSNAEFVITNWTENIEDATVWDEGTEDVTVNLTFYTSTMPNNNADNHVVEVIEVEGDESIDPQEFEGSDAFVASVSDDGTLPLAGAVFEVTREVTTEDETTGDKTTSTQTAYFSEEDVEWTETDEDTGTEATYTKHIYLFEGWLAEDEEVPAGYTTSLTSASDGMIYIEGLDQGTYTVTEIAAPDGYNLLDGSISVAIEATYNGETGAILTHTVTYTYGDAGGTGVVRVLNNSGSELPSTGGMGVYIFYIVGAILVCSAVVVLVTRRRANRAA